LNKQLTLNIMATRKPARVNKSGGWDKRTGGGMGTTRTFKQREGAKKAAATRRKSR